VTPAASLAWSAGVAEVVEDAPGSLPVPPRSTTRSMSWANGSNGERTIVSVWRSNGNRFR